MSFRNFSLRILLGVVTIYVIGIWAYLHFLSDANSDLETDSGHWKSGLHDSDICSAVVHHSNFFANNNTSTQDLTKREAIRFVRLTETCPPGEWDEMSGTYIPDPNPKYPDLCAVDLKLTRGRTLSFILLDDRLLIHNSPKAATDELVEISSKREEIFALIWQPK